MSFEKDAWTALVAQVEGDATLSALVNEFIVGFKERILSPSNFPAVVLSFDGVINEERLAMPKNKFVDINAKVSGKVKNQGTDPKQLIIDLLNLDEKIKNAIEKDLQLGSDATDVFVGDSEFNQLSDDISEVTFNVEIKTNRFTMGSR